MRRSDLDLQAADEHFGAGGAPVVRVFDGDVLEVLEDPESVQDRESGVRVRVRQAYGSWSAPMYLRRKYIGAAR